MAETAYGTAGGATLTALGRLVNADLGVRPFPTHEFRFYRRARVWFEPTARRAIIQNGKGIRGAAAQLGRWSVSGRLRLF
jgi:hypothetical protein